MARALRSLAVAAVAWTACLAGLHAGAAAQSLEVLATARANNHTSSVVFSIAPHQARVSELRLRSGSLPLALAGLEVAFADGTTDRVVLEGTLPPGHQSRPIPVDPQRAVRQVLLAARPGLRPGETTIQLLGKVEPPPQR